MAHIQNRSRAKVTVKKHDELTRHFPHDRTDEAERYVNELRAQGLKPQVEVLDEAYLVRYTVNGRRKSFTARSAADADLPCFFEPFIPGGRLGWGRGDLAV